MTLAAGVPRAGPLHGIRVLDFGRYIAGPYCGALLADLGAQVIRIEKVGGSEDRFLAPVTETGDGALFLQCNRGKLSMTLDPGHPNGREVVRRLVVTADVVVVNLPPPAIVALHLDYESLRAVKADIIVAAISAFGPVGPYSHRVGFDGIGQAMSGSMYLSGAPGEPMKAFVNFVDYTTALASALGVVTAILHRRATGHGQQVDCSLLASALTISNPYLIEQALLKKDRVATENRSQFAAPSDVYRTQDGFILVQCVGNPLFARWVALIEEPDWLTDPRFSDDTSRADHGELISKRMAEWCGQLTTDRALGELERAGIPAGPVYSPAEALGDPHIVAGGYFTNVDYPGAPAAAPIAEPPFRLSSEPIGVRGRAPTLGEHTDHILQELGYDAQEIARLRAGGII